MRIPGLYKKVLGIFAAQTPKLFGISAGFEADAVRTTGGGRIDTYRDTREAQVIAELSGSETVQCIAEEIVGPLRAHDAASGMDLLDTSVTFIKCNCNISLTARTLYIHRTSLPIGWKRVNRSQECRSKIRRICSY